MSIRNIDWRALLTTPYPRTCWGLSAESAIVLHDDRKAGRICASAPLPGDSMEMGPIGLSSVEPAKLAPVLEALREQSGGCRRPAVVVPNNWVRLHLLDFDEVPGRPAELENVVRWRLKKLLPVRPAELRVDVQTIKIDAGGWKVLSVSGVARAWEALESAFTEAGMQPAIVTPSIFPLEAGLVRRHGDTMVVQLEPGLMAVTLRVEGALNLVHTRLLPSTDGSWSVVARELRTLRIFLTDRLHLDGPVQVVPVATGNGTARSLRATCEAVDGFEVLPSPAVPPCPGASGWGVGALAALDSLLGGRPV